jgi:anti-sigma regulatory factor (Ser/Thr protein kinase)
MPSSIDIAVPGGLGLMLVRKFAQSMSYERTDGRNCLRIRIATT